MNLEALKNALNTPNTLIIKNGQVRIAADSLNKNFPAEVLAPFYGEAGTEITTARAKDESTGKKVVVEGEASLHALTDPAEGTAIPHLEGRTKVLAILELVGAEEILRVTLCYELRGEWNFLSSYAELPVPFDYKWQRYDYASKQSALDRSYTLKTDQNNHNYLCLTTHEHLLNLADYDSVSLKPGLNFVGRCAPAGVFGLFAQPKNGNALVLHGQVIPNSTVSLPTLRDDQLPWDALPPIPGIHLQAREFEVPFTSGSAIRLENLQFATYSPLSESWPLEDPSYGVAMACLGDLVIPAVPATKILVSARVSPERGDELAFECEFINCSLDDLLKASKILAGVNDEESLDSLMPGEIRKVIGQLGPQSASITLARPSLGAGYEVARTQLTIGMGRSEDTLWKPFGDLIKIGFDSVRIAVDKPFSNQRSVSATFRGRVEFWGVNFDVKVEAPSLYFSAQQAETTTFNLKSYFAETFKFLPKFLPDTVELADMRLEADPGSYYAFSMSLGTPYKIKNKYSLPTLQLAVSCITEKNATTKAKTSFWRWQFNASTKQGEQPVPVFELIKQLASDVAGSDKTNTDVAAFETGTPPAAIESLTINNFALSYDSKGKDFAFECWGRLKLDEDTVLECSFTVKKKHNIPKPDFGGTILLSQPGKQPLYFGLQFGTDEGNASVLAFSGTVTSGLPLSDVVSEIAGALGVTLTPSDFPKALNPALASLNGYLNIKTKDLVLSAETQSGTRIVVAVSNSGKNKKYVFLIDKNLHLGLSSLPLVGDKIAEASGKIAGIEDVGIENLQAIITYGLADSSANYKKDVVKLNELFKSAEARFNDRDLPRLPETKKGKIDLRVTYFFTDKPQEPIPFLFEDAPKSGEALSGPTSGVEPVRAGSQAEWLDVQRSFGPVSVKRLGIACEQGRIRFLLDSSLVVSGLTMGLQGLSLTFPIETLVRFDRKQFLKYLKENLLEMSTKLDGLSVTYENGPIAISGGLLKVDLPRATPDPHPGRGLAKVIPPEAIKYAYNGELLLKAETWALSVFGSFAQLESGESSLFAYGVLNATLGGPSFFFVTGVAAGFGYNRNLTLPTLNELPSFPLIAAIEKPRSGATTSPAGEDRLAKLTGDIDKYVYAASGQNWLAVGVRFTSFKVIKSFALLTVSFGNRFEIALLGLSELTMPFGAKKPIAFAQLALMVKFAPDDGVLKIAAQLTRESYILDEKCQLSGGFALYMWFKEPVKNEVHAGDFVLSIGGYHPNFKPPAAYPIVPRVAANWRVNNELTIKGGFYFALTPNAIMAGGALQANYESGRFKAWFDARVDFLLLWEPYHYEAHSKVSLGVSYTIDNWLIHKTINCQVGVDLTLQGPPFGGKAVVDLYVCSFTLDFGTPDAPPKSLHWQDFKNRFLPPVVRTQGENVSAPSGGATDSYCYSRAAAGLIRELPAGSDVDWIVNPETFVIVTASAIPCSEARWVNRQRVDPLEQETPLECSKEEFGVKPCEIQNHGLKSKHWIEWKKDVKTDEQDVEWEMEAISTRLPRAAWSPYDPNSKNKSSEELLTEERVTGKLTTGFKLTPRSTAQPEGTKKIKVADLERASSEHLADRWTTPVIPRKPLDQGKAISLLTVNEREIKTMRDHIASVLKKQDIPVTENPAPRYLQSAIASVLKRQDIAVTEETTSGYLQAAKEDGLLAKPVLCELGR